MSMMAVTGPILLTSFAAFSSFEDLVASDMTGGMLVVVVAPINVIV
jgi:hypothetical protein